MRACKSHGDTVSRHPHLRGEPVVAWSLQKWLVIEACDDHNRVMGHEHVAREWPIHGIFTKVVVIYPHLTHHQHDMPTFLYS